MRDHLNRKIHKAPETYCDPLRVSVLTFTIYRLQEQELEPEQKQVKKNKDKETASHIFLPAQHTPCHHIRSISLPTAKVKLEKRR